ncbi:hypothetical protein ACFQWH_10545 [Mycolicibacterium sp. GCM10028919]|uniref:hypothetical protein n=1 Tax=Mycolicibacterium sp. GCM10028919 TaxID=3273401 RepID=UPI003618A447
MTDPDSILAFVALAAAVGSQAVAVDDAWPLITNAHTSLIAPLLAQDTTSFSVPSNLPLGAAAILKQFAEALVESADATSYESVIMDAIDLAARIESSPRSAVAPRDDTVRVLAELPTGGVIALDVRTSITHPWRRTVADVSERLLAAMEPIFDTLPRLATSLRAAMTDTTCVFWPQGVDLSTRFWDLPLACRALAMATDLPCPSNTLLIGAFDGHSFVGPPDTELSPWIDAARREGRPLLVPIIGGWRRFPSDGSDPGDVRSSTSLEGAASAIWGPVWNERLAAAHLDELHALGWHVVDWRQHPSTQPIPDLRVAQVAELEQHWLNRDSGGSVAVLGGHKGSGRSCIVRNLARSLSAKKRRPWRVQVVSNGGSSFPTQAQAVQIARHALGSEPVNDTQPRLLVFEDLRPLDDGTDSELLAAEVLRRAAEHSRAMVLGVLEYSRDAPADWNTDRTFVCTAVVGRAAKLRFVRDMKFGDANFDDEAAKSAVNESPNITLRQLTMVLAGLSDVAARRKARYSRFNPFQSETLATAAALGLAHVEIDSARIDFLSRDDRLLFGIEPGRRAGFSRLVDISDCQDILDQHLSPATPSRRQQEDAVEWLLTPEVMTALETGDGAAVTLLLGIRLYSLRVCRRVLANVEQEGVFEQWLPIVDLASAVRVTALVAIMSNYLAETISVTLAERVSRGFDDIPSADLVAIMRAFQIVENFLTPGALDELVRSLSALVNGVFEKSAGTPRERFSLLAALDRFHRDDTSLDVAELTLDVLKGMTNTVDDCRLVARVDEFYRRAMHDHHDDQAQFRLGQESPVRSIIDRTPKADDGIELLVENINLRLLFERKEWEVHYEAYIDALRSAAERSTPQELARAVNAMRAVRPQFGAWLLNKWEGFPDLAHRMLLQKADASDAYALLNAVGNGHLLVASRIIGADRHGHLARRLAQRAGDSRDAKGLGLLLSATHAIEDSFGGGGNAFSYIVAEHVSLDKAVALIDNDQRPSVQFYLIKGLWDARASYRKDLLDVALHAAVRSIRAGRSHWGPTIALRLAIDLEIGSVALDRLRDDEGSSADRLLRGMTSGLTAHARSMYHRLGRTLHPELPAKFLGTWELTPFAEGLKSEAPGAALEVCTEVAATLREAGFDDAGPAIIAAVGGAEYWTGVLRSTPGSAFTPALDNLATLDRGTAGDVLDNMLATPLKRRHGQYQANLLTERLRRALLEGPTAAPHLVAVVDRVRPGLARQAWDEATANQHARYVFRGEISQLQDTISQSAAAVDLVKAGIGPDAPGCGWVDTLYKVRMDALHQISGPRALGAVMSMFTAWNEGWGRQAADRVDVDRINARLRLDSTARIVEFIGVARVMAAVSGRRARDLVDKLTDSDLSSYATSSEPRRICQLAELALTESPASAPKLAEPLRLAIDALMTTRVVQDEPRHWLLLGRLCRNLSLVGGHTEVPNPEWKPNMVHHPTVAWAASQVGQPDWADGALERALAIARMKPFPTRSSDVVCLVLASNDTVEFWSGQRDWPLARAPFWLLRVLFTQSASDANIDALLTAAEPEIRARVSAPWTRANWDAHDLRTILNARKVTRGLDLG